MNVIIANKYKEMLNGLDIEVIKSLEGEYDVDEIINTFSNFYFDRMILDMTAIKDYSNFDVIQKLSINLDMSRVILILDDSEQSSSKVFLSKLVSVGIYNFTRNIEGIKYLLNHPNSYRDVAHIQNMANAETSSDPVIAGEINHVKVIGLKNITEHAGATTLTYLLKKGLEKRYSVVAMEVDKRDFSYFPPDENLISTTTENLPREIVKKNDCDVIFVDLNNYPADDFFDDVLYLVEPSILKLNKLSKKGRRVFDSLKGKKVVLNKSFVPPSDESVFEYESGVKIFYNIPPIDERTMNHKKIEGLLLKLGFVQVEEGIEENRNKLFGLFKF